MFKKAGDIFRVAATYVGTVIGAGFASGQELVQFFISYGSIGLAGIAVAGIMFAWLGSYIIELGFRLKATGYHQILYHTCGSRIGGFLDFITGLFLFGGLTIMLAGAGTVGRDYFDLSYNTGLTVMAIVVALTVMTGMKGISIVNSLVTPLLVISTIVIGVNSILYHGISPALFFIDAPPNPRPAPNWVISSLLYVSYNIILGSTVLAPLGNQISNRSVRLWGGLLGGTLLAVLGFFVAIIIILHQPDIFQYEVPMLYVSNLQCELTHAGYALMLIKAMYSTAMASLYGCTAKLQSVSGFNYHISLVIASLFAVICSQFGFANLIAMLYPLFGYIALIFTFKLVWDFFRGK